MPDNKFWASHRFMSPEIRELAIKECGDCRFFVTIQGAWERRLGCVADVWKYRTLSVRMPAAIHVMELMREVAAETKKIMPDAYSPLIATTATAGRMAVN